MLFKFNGQQRHRDSFDLYIFLFQLFTSVVVFGLFHGLLFLPVILSLIGPGERKHDRPKIDQAVQCHNGYYTVRLTQNGKGTIYIYVYRYLKIILNNLMISYSIFIFFVDTDDTLAK